MVEPPEEFEGAISLSGVVWAAVLKADPDQRKHGDQAENGLVDDSHQTPVAELLLAAVIGKAADGKFLSNGFGVAGVVRYAAGKLGGTRMNQDAGIICCWASHIDRTCFFVRYGAAVTFQCIS